jgi:hypothetical protein
MVKMSMGDKDVVNFQLGFSFEDIGNASSIKCDFVIEEKGRGIVPGELCAGTAYDLNFHIE